MNGFLVSLLGDLCEYLAVSPVQCPGIGQYSAVRDDSMHALNVTSKTYIHIPIVHRV